MELGFLGFSLAPRAQANLGAPAQERGLSPGAKGSLEPPQTRCDRGGSRSGGTSRPVPAQSKLVLGGAGSPAHHFRARQGARARQAPNSPAPANLPAGAR